METRDVSDVIALVEQLDDVLSEHGWERDSNIDLAYKYNRYRACLTIYCPDNDEDEDDD